MPAVKTKVRQEKAGPKRAASVRPQTHAPLFGLSLNFFFRQAAQSCVSNPVIKRAAMVSDPVRELHLLALTDIHITAGEQHLAELARGIAELVALA